MSLVKGLAFDRYVVVASGCKCSVCDRLLSKCANVFIGGDELHCRYCSGGMSPLPDSPIAHYTRTIGDEYRLCCVRVACADHCSHMCLNELELMCFGPPPRTVSECCNFCRVIHRVADAVKRGARTLPTMDAVEKMRVADLKQLRLDILGVQPRFRAADNTRRSLLALMEKLLDDIARASACHHVIE